jgi:hypothetical protein
MRASFEKKCQELIFSDLSQSKSSIEPDFAKPNPRDQHQEGS